MSDKRTERIAQLRIDLDDAKRERNELMASNVLLSQAMRHMRIALQKLVQSSCQCHTCETIRTALAVMPYLDGDE
jgi:hypothetical protein